MAQKTDKQKAKELVDEGERLFFEAKTSEEQKVWAEDTLSKMDKAIKFDPDNVDAWIWRGLAKRKLSDYQGAIDDYTKAIEIDPKDSVTWQNRGFAKNELGNHRGAFDDCTKAIELDPQNVIAWNNRGFAKNELGDHQSAIDDYTKAIELNPQIAAIWNNRGNAKNALGDHQDAIDDFTKAIEIDPKYAPTWHKRGEIKDDLGDYRGAIDDYAKAIELDPKNAAIWSNRGFAKNAIRDHQGAIDDCTKAIEIDPSYADAWKNRGFAKNALRDYQDAIDDFTKAIELNPKDAAAWLNRGIAKRHLGQHDDAIKDTNEAQKLEPENTYIRLSRLEAENADLRKKTEDHKGKYIKQMEDESTALQKDLSKYRRTRNKLLVALFVVIILYFLLNTLSCWWNLSCIATESGKTQDSDWLSTILSTVSRFSIISFIVFPIIWGIKLLNARINRAEILKWDLFSRNNVDNSIEYYRRELGNNRNDIIVDYMNNWINKNPADRLVALQRKKSANKEQPENETLLQEIKNLLEQLTKRNTKED